MKNNNSALLFCRLNRIIEGLPVEKMRDHIGHKFGFQIFPTKEGHRLHGKFLMGYAPRVSKQTYALTLVVDRFGAGSVEMLGWKLGTRDHVLVLLSMLQFMEDSGALQYGVWDAARSLNHEHVDAYDSLARMAEIDLRDINANLVREQS